VQLSNYAVFWYTTFSLRRQVVPLGIVEFEKAVEFGVSYDKAINVTSGVEEPIYQVEK